MAVIRWDPWGELTALQREMDRLAGRGADPSARLAAVAPPIDAYRTDDGLVVRVELPGMRPDDVDVSVNEGVLTISGERRVDADVPDEAWVRRERSVGRFERAFTLPEGTDPSGIEAAFADGLLELRIPHPPERKPHRVRIGQSGRAEQTIDVGDGSAGTPEQATGDQSASGGEGRQLTHA